jgi:hypothetical protein
MAHTFFCPNCGKRFDRAENLAGKKARCKDCQQVFVIPPVTAKGLAPARESQPRSIPPRSANPAPRYPSDDPYGLDEGPPLAAVRNTYAEDGEEFAPPERIRPVAPVQRKRSRRVAQQFAWIGPVTLGGIVLQASLLLLFGGFTYAESLTGATVTFEMLRVVFVGMVVLGLVVLYVVPFLESVVNGLLFLFIPFYSLYYIITRWESMRRPFLLLLSVNALPIAAALLVPAVQASRQAALRAQQRQQSPPADVATRAEPAPPRLPAAPVGGIHLVLNVSGVVDPQVSRAMGQRIGEIAKELNPRGVQARYVRQGNQLIFTIVPMRDPQAYADKIDFGTVTSVQGGTIVVSVTPESAAQVANAAPNSPVPDPDNAPAPGPIGPRRFPRRGPLGGPRPR